MYKKFHKLFHNWLTWHESTNIIAFPSINHNRMMYQWNYWESDTTYIGTTDRAKSSVSLMFCDKLKWMKPKAAFPAGREEDRWLGQSKKKINECENQASRNWACQTRKRIIGPDYNPTMTWHANCNGRMLPLKKVKFPRGEGKSKALFWAGSLQHGPILGPPRV